MRTLMLAAIVFAAGCASNAQPRSLMVDVFEQGRRSQVSAQGQHVFVVRISNRSQESVMIHTISLSSYGNHAFDSGDQSVEQALDSGETEDFPMYVEVATATRYATIDSVDVSIAAESNSKGAFTESSSQSVRSM